MGGESVIQLEIKAGLNDQFTFRARCVSLEGKIQKLTIFLIKCHYFALHATDYISLTTVESKLTTSDSKTNNNKHIKEKKQKERI